MKNSLLIAHRGYSDLYPENTLLAFEKAIDANADMIELDVHLTKDAELVVTHDALLGRTIKQKGHIWEYTLKELQSFDAGEWKGEEFKGQMTPSLDEVLELCKNRIEVNIEIKKETMHSLPLYHLMLTVLERTLMKHQMNDQIVISSFDPFFLSLTKDIKNFRKGLINGFPQLSNCMEFCQSNSLYSYHPNLEGLTIDHVTQFKKSGIQVFSWTAKTIKDIEKLRKWGINGIISNIIP